MLTAIAATDGIGEDHRFTTKAVLKDPNTVVLVGGGDVLLGAGTDSASVSGRAGLGTLANARRDRAAPGPRRGRDRGDVSHRA